MSFNVMLLESASKDLETIYRYLKRSAGVSIALKEIETIEAACDSLAINPERGHIPQELEKIATFEYRQIITKAYRIIYQVADINVFIFGIIHGRRNIQEVLKQRILIR